MNYRGTRAFVRALIRDAREEVRLLTKGASNPGINELLKEAERSLQELARYSAKQRPTVEALAPKETARKRRAQLSVVH